jgi:hypothetical protein
MLILTAAQWLVLDNLKQGWPYHTNLDRDLAEKAYLWCVESEYVKDGLLTESGRGALLCAKVGRATA